MRNRLLGQAAPGIVFMLFALYIVCTDQALSRGANSTVTSSSHPMIFWAQVVAFGLPGLLVVIYSLAKALGAAGWYTDRLEALVDRVSRDNPDSK